MAALAGLAEDPPKMKIEGQPGNLGLRIRDNFMTQKKNEAGCYCIDFCVDGEHIEVVIDEWFPFYIDSKGKEQFCFSRNKVKPGERISEGEVWVQMLEKAWAKICGCYEASEMGTAREAFNSVDGTPSQNFFMTEIDA